MKSYDIKEIASGLNFTKFNAGEYVFRAGQYGDKFFIIMRGVAAVKIPYGLTSSQIIDRWLKFRDVSLNQVNERGIREAQVKKEYSDKQRLRVRYDELKQWYESSFTVKSQEKVDEFHSYEGFDWDYECAVLRSGSSFGE